MRVTGCDDRWIDIMGYDALPKLFFRWQRFGLQQREEIPLLFYSYRTFNAATSIYLRRGAQY